jgi:anion-transporting  ArsA/GET3 family ATPase
MMLDRLQNLQLIVVTGKGGVGKSVISAALGCRLAARGRRVLMIEVDPRETLHQLMDVAPSGGELVKVRPRVHLQHLQPRTVLDEIVREKLKVGALVRRVLSSPIHLHFTEGAPGLKETAVFGRVLRLVEGHGPRGTPTPEVVVIDAPATGHGVSWLAAPQLISDVIRSGPVGHMAADIAAFMNDRHRFGVVAVTTAEEMPVQESLELIERLERRLSREPEGVVVNAMYPKIVRRTSPRDPAASLWSHRRRVNERELSRLKKRWRGKILELPLLPLEPGPRLVEELGRTMETAARKSS